MGDDLSKRWLNCAMTAGVMVHSVVERTVSWPTPIFARKTMRVIPRLGSSMQRVHVHSTISKVLGKLRHRRDLLKLARNLTLPGELMWEVRAKLLTQVPRLLLGRRRSDDLRLALPGGPVFLGRDSLYIDAMTLQYLWNDNYFGANCRDRVVLDLGAHKGYFGAWALIHGASYVLSCEPQSENFKLLAQAHERNARTSDWEVMRVAVGAKAGDISLFVSRESWGHTVYEQLVWMDPVSVEKVPMIPLATLLDQAQNKRPNHSIVIKLNVEGGVGDVLMPATANQLAQVVEVHFDYEPGSPYDPDRLLQHLAAAGLDEVHHHHGWNWSVFRTDTRTE